MLITSIAFAPEIINIETASLMNSSSYQKFLTMEKLVLQSSVKLLLICCISNLIFIFLILTINFLFCGK